MKKYEAIARSLNAYNNCITSNNKEWEEKHLEKINEYMESSPSGSGIDSGTMINFFHSTDNRLEFDLDFHHMNENGMYDGWTSHSVIVKPDLMFGFSLKITGKNRNMIKEYLNDVFYSWLNEEVRS